MDPEFKADDSTIGPRSSREAGGVAKVPQKGLPRVSHVVPFGV